MTPASPGGPEGYSPDSQPAIEDQERLEKSLADLSRLQASRFTLDELLTRVAAHAVQAIPPAEGAGLTLLLEQRGHAVVAAAPFVAEIDRIQHRINEGPSFTAVATGEAVLSRSLENDPRWPRFGGAVARRGVHSALALPLSIPGEVVGALTLYARPRGAFDQRLADIGRTFADPATITVLNAKALAQTQELAARLQSTLDARGVVDRAVGIVMSRSGCSEKDALSRLRTMSQHQHVTLSTLAARIVDEAVRRAHARQPAVPPVEPQDRPRSRDENEDSLSKD